MHPGLGGCLRQDDRQHPVAEARLHPIRPRYVGAPKLPQHAIRSAVSALAIRLTDAARLDSGRLSSLPRENFGQRVTVSGHADRTVGAAELRDGRSACGSNNVTTELKGIVHKRLP
jgi:hypothetical protein